MNAVIAVLPGDGIGPEVVRAAVGVLHVVAARFGHRFEFRDAPIGGAAIDDAGEPLPAATLALCRDADGVLLGAVGGPRWQHTGGGARPEAGLLELRRALGLAINVRPITVHPAGAAASPLRAERLQGVDLVFVRELTGGIYFGDKRRAPNEHGGETATDVCSYSTAEIEAVVRFAGALAQRRRGRLTSIDKANVLETSRLWRSVTERVVRDEFPDIELRHLLVDAAALQLLTEPAGFDVIVTENMFGDILTDEAAALAGSIGLLPSASLAAGAGNDERRAGVYEPIHGSAPDIAGLDRANPIGTVLSAALLLRHSLGLADEAAAVEGAVARVLDDGLLTADLGGTASTTQVAAAIAAAL